VHLKVIPIATNMICDKVLEFCLVLNKVLSKQFIKGKFIVNVNLEIVLGFVLLEICIPIIFKITLG